MKRKSAEERHSSGQSHRRQGRFHPSALSDKSASHLDRKSGNPAWKQIRDRQQAKKGHDKPSTFCSVCDRTGLCLCLQSDRLEPTSSDSQRQESDCKFHVDFCVANAHSVTGLPQKKGINPNCCHMYMKIKYVKDISCVGHLSSANFVTNIPPVVIDPPVGARLHNFWEKWEVLGSSPKVVTTLREGYTEPMQVTNYHKQLSKPIQTVPLFGGTASVGEQKCSGTGSKPKLSRVLQPAIFGTQTQQPVETVLDLSTLNTFLNTESFKLETPETIRTSLQTGEWVTSIDFKDAYFHIPIYSQSRKYMRFHIQCLSYPFKALAFDLSTAHMAFTVVSKEVKLMALQRGI